MMLLVYVCLCVCVSVLLLGFVVKVCYYFLPFSSFYNLKKMGGKNKHCFQFNNLKNERKKKKGEKVLTN